MLTVLALALVPSLSPQATQIIPPQRPIDDLRPPVGIDVLPVSPGLGQVISETHIAFFVEENSTGSGVDLNGDGDQDDRIVAWYERSSGELTITAIDGRFLALGDGFVAVERREEQSGQDFDGDGMVSHDVAFVIDLASGSITNLGVETLQLVAAGGPHLAIRASPQFSLRMMMYSHTTGQLVNTGFDTLSALAGDDGIAWMAPENSFGGGDLNGDGDVSDTIAVMMLPDQSTLLSTATEVSQLLAFENGSLLFRASEGVLDRDIDQDGSLDDSALFRYDAPTDQRTTLGVISGAVFPSPILDDDLLWFRASESFFGDLNGDGDLDDPVVLGREIFGPAIFNTGLAGRFGFREDDRVLVHVDESLEGDRNGDGDNFDNVPSIWNRAQGTTVNLGSAADSIFEGGISGGVAVFTASENGNGVDQNNDGDLSDDYVVVYDASSGRQIPIDLPVGSKLIANSDYRKGVVARVSELQFGSDLSGDGDLQDAVAFVLEFPDLRVTNTGLATFASGSFVKGTEVFMVGFESDAQADLNGDGDSLDRVFIVGSLP